MSTIILRFKNIDNSTPSRHADAFHSTFKAITSETISYLFVSSTKNMEHDVKAVTRESRR